MKRTRLCSLLLAFSMVLSMAVIFTAPVSAEEIVENVTPATAPNIDLDFSDPSINWWNGSTALKFDGGGGTDDDPFQIATPAQLALVSELTSELSKSYYFVVDGVTYIAENRYYAAQYVHDNGDVYYFVRVDDANKVW